MARNPLRRAVDGGRDDGATGGDDGAARAGDGQPRDARAPARRAETGEGHVESVDDDVAKASDGAGATRETLTNHTGTGVRSSTPFANTTRAMFDDTRRNVFKQEVDRRSSLNPQVQRAVKRSGGLPKPYDSALLRDVSSHAIVQAFIDTLAQDVAGANWSLRPIDESADVADERIDEAEALLRTIHPEKSFRDILEQTTRNLLELGDAAWVKHYYADGSGLAELVPVDSARMYKRLDKHGMVEGYLQAQFSQIGISDEFDTDDVVWFEWASRTDHYYGHGPTEKGIDVIMLLDELSQKEKKDLMEGMPSGIVSAREDPDNPLPTDEYETVKEQFRMEEGERHRVVVSRGEWDFTNFSGSYDDLQVLERNRYWVTVLGGVYKVNPSYAGFDFENVNRATDESQQEAYAQRGFRQTLRQLEEAITRQLVQQDISEKLEFIFEREQTTSERAEQVSFLEQSASAAEAWANVGIEVDVSNDGTIRVEPGTVTEDDVDSDDAGGGGLFGSTDAQAPPTPTATPTASDARNERERASPTPEGESSTLATDAESDGTRGVSGRSLSKEQLQTHEDVLLDAFTSQIWPAGVDAVEKRVWSTDDGVPQYVIDSVREAIDAGAVFDDITNVPSEAVDALESIMRDNLLDDDGWDLGQVADSITDRFPAVSDDKAEVVARTETASVLNTAREEGYEDREGSGDFTFYWQGPDDSRTTEACEELKERTNPSYGGTPLSMPALKRAEKDVHDQHFPHLTEFRDHTIHPNERHTFVRHVETPGETSVAASVDVDPSEVGNHVYVGPPEDAPADAEVVIHGGALHAAGGTPSDHDGATVAADDETNDEVEREADASERDPSAKQPDKYDPIDFAGYPEAASENAQMALDAREETGNPNDCGTQTGWARANQLADGETLSPDTVGRMAQFRRHQSNYDPDADRDDCGWMMWKAWGGEEGVAWAERVSERMDRLDEEADGG